ncbi:single-stranded DNA-binding protein [Nocardia sp. NPDC050710]|uniref:single-stranded DNA-binding protein n=1 Tax=Nocardia sp. NPDC050710 TaxID=3157220 RepID=UPI0033FF1435
MSGETTLTVIGNLTADPELRFTPNGAAVVNFTVASTPRVFDRQANQWKDGPALFMRCTMWRDAAENVNESLTRGARVIVTGKLQQRSYEDRQGQKRIVVELVADEVGVSLKYAVAKPIKRTNNGWGNNTNRPGKPTANTSHAEDPRSADNADPYQDFAAPEGVA